MRLKKKDLIKELENIGATNISFDEKHKFQARFYYKNISLYIKKTSGGNVFVGEDIRDSKFHKKWNPNIENLVMMKKVLDEYVKWTLSN